MCNHLHYSCQFTMFFCLLNCFREMLNQLVILEAIICAEVDLYCTLARDVANILSMRVDFILKKASQSKASATIIKSKVMSNV